MACSNCGKTSVPCGCKDGPFTTVPGCPCPPDINCPTPQKCVEKLDSACVFLKDYTITDSSTGTIFPQDASLEQIIQIITLFLTDPNCIQPNSPCQSVSYVYPTQITSSSIAIAWYPSPTAVSYQVEWKHITQVTWTQLPVQTTPTPNVAVISPLLPGNTYFVRVNTNCAAGNCYSVTLRINTKS